MSNTRGTPECPVGAPEWCAWAVDKIQGLEADLFLAVETAYGRGAREWTRLNYPEWYERLSRAAALDELAALGQEMLP